MENSEFIGKNLFKQKLAVAINDIVALNLGKDNENHKLIVTDFKRRHYEKKFTYSFMVPVSFYKKFISAVPSLVKPKLLQSITDVCQLSQEWEVSLDDVTFDQNTIIFKLKFDSLAQYLLNYYVTKSKYCVQSVVNQLDKSMNFDLFHPNILLVCYLTSTVSHIRTLLLASLFYSRTCIFLQLSNSDQEYEIDSMMKLLNLPLKFQKARQIDIEQVKVLLQSSAFYNEACDSNCACSYIKFDKKCIELYANNSIQFKAILNTKIYITPNVIKSISLLEEKISQILESKLSSNIIFIGSHGDFIYAQQLSLLLLIYIEKKDLKLFPIFKKLLMGSFNIFHQPLNTDCNNFSDILKKTKDNLSDSFIAKYGEKSSWIPLANSLAPSILKLDILSIAPNSTVNKNSLDGENNISRFIMYNYSRIATLLNCHDQQVKNGYYSALPDHRRINFSLLNDESEVLLIEQIWNFGDVRDYSSDSPKLFKPHLLVTYLNNLSRSFSCFYNRNHILGENLAHLLPLMNARLYLVKTVQFIMNEVFKHFYIVPSEQM